MLRLKINSSSGNLRIERFLIRPRSEPAFNVQEASFDQFGIEGQAERLVEHLQGFMGNDHDMVITTKQPKLASLTWSRPSSILHDALHSHYLATKITRAGDQVGHRAMSIVRGITACYRQASSN